VERPKPTSRALWIALASGATLSAGLVRTRRRARARARRSAQAQAQIVELASSTSFDRETGAVRSVQEADLMIEQSTLETIWTPAHLERLARTYWRFLSRVTLGLIRVRYTQSERSLVLLARPLELLSFLAPEYEMSATRGLVRWRIARGLLVSRRGHDGRGYLQIEVRRYAGAEPRLARLHVEVAVANFYPSIASRLGLALYNATQSRIHVIVTYGFLRSLARLDLAESRVGHHRADQRACVRD
jgi:hypothetical protein